MTETAAPEAPEAPEAPSSPSPADMAKKTEPENPEPPQGRSPDEYEAEIQKLRRENASWRTKYREAEPIVKQHQERQEAAKTELQRAQEALDQERRTRTDMEQGYTRLELAVIHNLPPDDIDLIGSGSREEMEARAQRLSALHSATRQPASPPPSNRPVEGLRPGASPEPPKPADDSYPTAWAPKFMREKESRSQHGQ